MSNSTNVVLDEKEVSLKDVIKDLVLAYNNKRQSILDSFNVFETDVDIIRYLEAEEQKKMKELGEKFQIKLSTLTSIIDKLEKGKLVKRKNSKKDRRVIYIQTTPNAKKLLHELEHTTNGLEKAFTKKMSASEQDAILKGLNLIRSHLSDS